MEDALGLAKKTYWDQENNIFINKLNLVCKNWDNTYKDVSLEQTLMQLTGPKFEAGNEE